MVTIAGSGVLSTILDVIAQSLELPVMILLIVFVILILIEIGNIISEYTNYSKLSDEELNIIINGINFSKSSEEINDYIKQSNLSDDNKELLFRIVDTYSLKKDTREAYVRKIIESYKSKKAKTLRRTDIISKVSSGCGLLGTLIPLGPGLASLGGGDIVTLSTQLIIAFNTTTVGLSVSLVAFFISKIRRAWYEDEISTIYTISEAILGVEYA